MLQKIAMLKLEVFKFVYISTRGYKEYQMSTILKWLGYALTVMFVAWIIPGISVENFLSALLVAVVLGLINVFIKPILMLITLPINFITLGLFTLVLNALLLMLAGYVTPGFDVDGFWSAFFGALILSILSALINNFTKDKN